MGCLKEILNQCFEHLLEPVSGGELLLTSRVVFLKLSTRKNGYLFGFLLPI